MSNNRQVDRVKNKYENKLDRLFRSRLMYEKDDLDRDKLQRFSRFGYKDMHNAIGKTREYLFFTKPDLNLYSDGRGRTLNREVSLHSPTISEIHRYDNRILHNLQSSINGELVGDIPFMYILSNTVRNTLDLPDNTATEFESNRTRMGTRIHTRKHSLLSDEDHDFSLEFEEDRRLSIYLLFKAWDEYSNLKNIGLVAPERDYILRRILHDQITVFKIIVGRDGRTILYYACAVGVYLKNAPRQSFSNVENAITHSVGFKANFIDDMDPAILFHFNSINNFNRTPRRMNSIRNGVLDGDWARNVFVTRNNRKGVYELNWVR